MATIDESTVSPRQFHHRRFPHLQPLSPRVPSSIERHFEQYLIDHHHYPKLPSISKQTNRHSIDNTYINDKDFLSYRERQISSEFEHDNGPISRLLNSDQYRRAQTRLIEYRHHSKIPGVALTETITNSHDISSTQINERNEITLPLKEILIETTRTKLHHQQQDDNDINDDDSILSNESDRRRRAKHWIKEHQFFFTEYQ
ncbi:unnamed protein product [Rotaria sp. Silwood1]|nr:unnamed protein product [Rotaria sp. Silwood1]CAF1393996.1 unnamed protein product [Rotaria sp. Silwood1]CAF1397315.1 unnamed protein product [Rotaria sp. Silwood1]CAF3579252.1 unnamed protein product [Rotaria sp. Silwood1]CAF3588247.1 unnamed protein product [Rotaria sp. Silwood1]